jgi:hypothetical protein
MSYTRTTLGPRGRGPTTLSGVSSQPPGRRVSTRALVQMAGVSSQPPGRRVRLPVASKFGIQGTLGDTQTVVDPTIAAADLATLKVRTDAILARLDEDARTRKVALVIAGVSALFAAVKLGFIAIPALRGATKL